MENFDACDDVLQIQQNRAGLLLYAEHDPLHTGFMEPVRLTHTTAASLPVPTRRQVRTSDEEIRLSSTRFQQMTVARLRERSTLPDALNITVRLVIQIHYLHTYLQGNVGNVEPLGL